MQGGREECGDHLAEVERGYRFRFFCLTHCKQEQGRLKCSVTGPWLEAEVDSKMARAFRIFWVLSLASVWWVESVVGLGTAGKVAVSYGANGQALCRIEEDGSQLVSCFGTDEASVFSAPPRIPMIGVTGGDGFVCGLEQLEQTPYCWGNNIYVPAGVPLLPNSSVKYVSISAGDNHLCALREGGSSVNSEARKKNSNVSSGMGPWVDCWGYNMTGSFVSQPLVAISAGSFFTCGLFASNRTAICWGDDSGYNVIQGVPNVAFSSIAAGGYHVCGIEEGSDARTICWGRTLGPGGPPQGVFLNGLVGGKFHSCGLKADTLTPVCWGLATPSLVPTPENESMQFMAAGDYFTCGVAGGSLKTVCWGSNYPLAPVSATAPVQSADPGCSNGSSTCTPPSGNSGHNGGTIQVPIIIGELVTAVVVISALLLGAYFWVRYKLAKVALKNDDLDSKAPSNNTPPTTAPTTDASLHHHHGKKYSFRSTSNKTTKGGSARHEREESMNPRAHVFRYQELQEATGDFGTDHEIGRGSFSIVYKGVLANGTVVAVKRAMGSTTNPDKVPESKEFRNELDLLSRLNHAHLLNLLGYCEEGGERLLVYEYMANGTLFEHLHGEKVQLNWVTRLKIAVQAARGLEYLHGYACHPVIHRDIKSCNILLDEEWNARVADFGLSLFGPENSNCPLSEPPAGTLGYLDPEYYRLHYLTTKSDIYSFGVLLLEIMSGRKAIDMGYPQGNIVEWAVPLIKAGLTRTILDNRIEDPPDLDALDKLAKVAAQCVRMRGKDRPSMEKVTTSLERALALMLGTPTNDGQLILPTEVVLGSARLNKKTSSRRSSSHKSESRQSDSDYGEPVREREKDFVDVPVFSKLRGYNAGVDDLPRVSSLTRVQSFNKVHSLTRNQSLTRAYSFNRAYSQRTASSRVDEEDLEMQSFGSPPFVNSSLRPVDHEVPRDMRIDSWPQHIRGPSSSLPCDSEISPESPRQL